MKVKFDYETHEKIVFYFSNINFPLRYILNFYIYKVCLDELWTPNLLEKLDGSLKEIFQEENQSSKKVLICKFC